MGIIEASIKYKGSIDYVRNELNFLEEQCYKIAESKVRNDIIRRCQTLRQEINWLDDDKEALFEAIDKALEEK